MGAAGCCRSMRLNQTKKSNAMFREMRIGERPQTKNCSVMFISSAPGEMGENGDKAQKERKIAVW